MDTNLAIVERHLGLMPGNEAEQAEARIEAIAGRIKAQIDLDVIVQVAQGAQQPPMAAAFSEQRLTGEGLKLAYANDRSFGFYYQEDLDTLRDAGVQLIPLNTLADPVLPAVDGLLIGGGFPEMFVAQLAANQPLRQDIRQAVANGLPVYAECGGLMYLSRSLRWNEQVGDMVGIIPGDVVMGARPVGRGYASLGETTGGLWPPHAETIPAHEFHYSHLENLDAGLTYAYRVLRGQGIDGTHDGFVQHNLVASYCHRRGSGARGWIAPFLNKVTAYQAVRIAARPAAINAARQAA